MKLYEISATFFITHGEQVREATMSFLLAADNFAAACSAASKIVDELDLDRGSIWSVMEVVED